MFVCRRKLGPRIIPFFRDIIKTCAVSLNESDAQVRAETIAVLHSLLASIPSFWSGGDFLLIIELYLKQHSSEPQHQESKLASFVKTLAKRAQPKVLLPSLCDLWIQLCGDTVGHL